MLAGRLATAVEDGNTIKTNSNENRTFSPLLALELLGFLSAEGLVCFPAISLRESATLSPLFMYC